MLIRIEMIVPDQKSVEDSLEHAQYMATEMYKDVYADISERFLDTVSNRVTVEVIGQDTITPIPLKDFDHD